MRTGAEYRQALRDGRRVWVMGEGLVDDVTTHPATREMVDEYVAWYDLHVDPAWRDIAIRPADAQSERTPWADVVPKSADDLGGMGRFFSATTFLSAGNITHTPCYGHMIALGLLASVEERGVSPEQIADAARYRETIAETGRFLTFCGGAPTIGARLREDPAERTALKLILDWRLKESAKADVRQTIREEYDGLPEIYDRRLWEDKVERTFQFMFERYPGEAVNTYEGTHDIHALILGRAQTGIAAFAG